MAGAIMTAASDCWGTPQALFDALHAEFRFTLDAAADASNHKLPRWFGPGAFCPDGLIADWSADRVFVNPPFSDVDRWIEKVFTAARHGALVVMLIKARIDTAIWHQLVMPGADEVRLICGRLTYEQPGKRAAAPFPSCIVVFKPGLPGGPPPQFSSVGRDGKPLTWVRPQAPLFARTGLASGTIWAKAFTHPPVG